MKHVLAELWHVFWQACKETPRGMLLPFKAFWQVATHNPVLEKPGEAKSADGERHALRPSGFRVQDEPPGASASPSAPAGCGSGLVDSRSRGPGG